MNIPDIRISDYEYTLPVEKIAQFPLPERDLSKLLCLSGKEIHTEIFRNLSHHIPEGSIMVFNDTRVIRARLLFQKETGTTIEIFCLEPMKPTSEIQSAFQQTGNAVWKCLVGNSKRWKSSPLIKIFHARNEPYILKAKRIGRLGDDTSEVEFQWSPPELTFGEFLDHVGRIPLPPYIHREDLPSDNDRYQTIYAIRNGSVAAPTAGLHFTENILESLKEKKVIREQITLHISMGTFKPVTSSSATGHPMHSEKFLVSGKSIRNLLDHVEQPVIAVGTTSVRTLESLYWAGVKRILHPGEPLLTIEQWEPYIHGNADCIPLKASLEALSEYIDETGCGFLSCETGLMIIPGYRFRLIHGMITNFHQPRSTLLLLVAAFIGERWKKVYDYALNNNYRFLSYGDACLFLNRK